MRAASQYSNSGAVTGKCIVVVSKDRPGGNKSFQMAED